MKQNEINEAHTSVVIDPVKHDEQPEPKVGQLWECINNESLHLDDITLGELYTICHIDADEWVVIRDNKSDERYYSPEKTGEKAEFHTHFRFHSDPNEKPKVENHTVDPLLTAMQNDGIISMDDNKSPQIMMVSDPTIPSPELLAVYEALDAEGKKIMREKMPNVKWPVEKVYVSHKDYRISDNNIFGHQTNNNNDFIFIYPINYCTPEIDHEKGEIRFVKL